MDMQYQYTEKYVKDIAEAIRFIAGSTDTYSIKEMPAAIAAANPPILGKPEDLFEAQFNAQLSAGSAQCLSWAIFSKYPDDSYMVISNVPESLTNTLPVAKRGMLFNEDFTGFIPCCKLNVDAGSNQWVIYFTRGENSDACGITLDSDGNPHIDKDMPFIMPTGPRTNYPSRGYNANNGFFYSAFHNTGTYNLNDSSVWSYLVSSGDITKNPVFKNRFKAFGASNLNGRIPSEIYSVISDGNWHTGSELISSLKITDFIDASGAPSTVKHAHFFNRLSYDSNNNLKFFGHQGWGGHPGPSVMYLTDDGDRWYLDISRQTYEFKCMNDHGTDDTPAHYKVMPSYYGRWGDYSGTSPLIEDGHGVYPFNDGANKAVISFTNYAQSNPLNIGENGYMPPRSVNDLKSYIPFRTYDILDQNGNVLLPANATLADFGIS